MKIKIQKETQKVCDKINKNLNQTIQFSSLLSSTSVAETVTVSAAVAA